MDNLMSFAKKGLDAYEKSQSNVSKTGGQEYNQENTGGGPNINNAEAVQHAAKHGSGESSLFSSALGFLSENKSQHSEPVNEEHVINSHKEAYENGNAGSLPASSLGSAAALQVLKQFTGGSSGGGGGSQTQLISMAMAEATKLFDSSGGAASGNKQDAVNGAAMTVMKLLVQSKFSGGSVGGGDSGGLGSLMGLASKFM